MKQSFYTLSFLLFAMALLCCKPSSKGTPVNKEKIATDTCGAVYPQAEGLINDFTHLFTPAQKLVLDSIISDNEQRTTNQIAIVTVEEKALGKCNVLDYANALGNYWGVGQKGKNNGTIIVICLEIRELGIASGSGIQAIFPDEEAKTIMEKTMIPEFKQNNYFEGTKKGLLAIIEKTK